MRLIDADKLIDKAYDVSLAYGMTVIGVTEEDIEDAPTVEAVPVTEKAFEMFEADYKNRLKADLEAILVDLQLEIEELDSRAGYDGDGMPTFSTDYIRKKKVNELIQQKINAVKGE